MATQSFYLSLFFNSASHLLYSKEEGESEESRPQFKNEICSAYF